MTTDDFTEAARVEALRAWVKEPDRMDSIGTLGAHMAEWARTHLAAQEPTDAEVLALQDCLYGRTGTWVPGVEVRAALSAAHPARRNEEKRAGK